MNLRMDSQTLLNVDQDSKIPFKAKVVPEGTVSSWAVNNILNDHNKEKDPFKLMVNKGAFAQTMGAGSFRMEKNEVDREDLDVNKIIEEELSY